VNHRVVFLPPDYFINPPTKADTMTEQPDDTNFKDDRRIYWNQLRAIELCRAVSLGDTHTADALIAEVSNDDDEVHLVAGLAHVAVSLARTVAEQHPSTTENRIWAALEDRSHTGLAATHEIVQMIEAEEQ